MKVAEMQKSLDMWGIPRASPHEETFAKEMLYNLNTYTTKEEL